MYMIESRLVEKGLIDLRTVQSAGYVGCFKDVNFRNNSVILNPTLSSEGY